MHDHPKLQREGNDLLLNFGEYGQEVEVAAISQDGRRVLTVRDVGVAEIWDVATRNRVGVLQPTSRLKDSDAAPTTRPFEVFIEAAALNRDGSLALLGLNDGTAGVYRVGDGARLSMLLTSSRRPGGA